MLRSGSHLSFFLLLLITSVYSGSIAAQVQPAARPSKISDSKKAVIQRAQEIIFDVRTRAFPEIAEKEIKVGLFNSDSIFFKARFSFNRFFTFRDLTTKIYVNPLVFELNAPEDGLRAIIAHELAHALYYKQRNRLILLGLIRLVNDGSNARFERRADLTAIARGFGEGLAEYRKWLYKNVPEKELAAKRRDYFSPDEIVVLMDALQSDPAVLKRLVKKVPRNLQEVQLATSSANVQLIVNSENVR